jgi:hypothetical protein
MEEFELRILETMDEQHSVRFTGRVNVLSKMNRQYLGHVLFKDGEVVQTILTPLQGFKALTQILIQEYRLQSFNYIVEPEIVGDSEKQIHYAYSFLKRKLGETLKLYRESLKLRPPENVRILVQPEFIFSAYTVTPQEFDVLSVLTEYNHAQDVYQHCELLDHEITMALVSLRMKKALKVLPMAESPQVK